MMYQFLGGAVSTAVSTAVAIAESSATGDWAAEGCCSSVGVESVGVESKGCSTGTMSFSGSGIGEGLYLVNVSNSFLIARPTSVSTTAKYAEKANTAKITTPVVARTCL